MVGMPRHFAEGLLAHKEKQAAACNIIAFAACLNEVSCKMQFHRGHTYRPMVRFIDVAQINVQQVPS